MIKLAVIFLAVVGMAGIALPVYAQEKAEEGITSVSGEVVSIDPVKSEVVVKQLKDAVAGTYENITCSVVAETKIQKEGTILTLSDLKTGDKVTIKYATDVLGKQKAESIAVEVKEIAPVK